MNAFSKTIEKLSLIRDRLPILVRSQQLGEAEELVSSLRSYADCFYCQDFRTELLTHTRGCCDKCPLHWYGENLIGRKRPYNGCYVMIEYREMVRLAWWFKEDSSIQSAEVLALATDVAIKALQEQEAKVDPSSPRWCGRRLHVQDHGENK